MLQSAIIAIWLSTIVSSLSIPSLITSRDAIDPTSPGTMAVSPEFSVLIGDGTQLVPVLLDSAHPCTFLVESNVSCSSSSPCTPPVTVSSSGTSSLTLGGDSTTCRYAPYGDASTVISGVTASGYIGFAGWQSTVDNIVIADKFVSPTSLSDFLGGASGILSMFGTSSPTCNSSTISHNYWPDEVESDGTFLYLAPRRSNTNGPGLISWGNTPNNTVIGNDRYNLTTVVAKTNITGHDLASQAESCAFAVPVDAVSVHSHDVGTVTSDAANHILATMSKFNVVSHSFAIDVASAFQPSGNVGSDGLVRVNCDAIPPMTSVRIGGTDLEMNPVDLIVDQGGVCYSAFRVAAQGEVLKLGQPFLKNVAMSVGWDLSVEFTARPYYAA